MNELFMNELFILCVIDNMKIKWFIVDYDKIKTTTQLINYFISIYNNNIAIKYNKKNIKHCNLYDIVDKNPNRISINIFT